MSQTESETVPSASAQTVSTPPRVRSGFLRKVVDWYTCRSQREKALAAASASPRAHELLARAKAAFATAVLLNEPADPARRELASAHSAALYAEALVWALWSFQETVQAPKPEDLFDGAAQVVRELALPEERIAEIRRLLAVQRLAIDLADRPPPERDAAALLLKRAALVAIDVRERPLRVLDGLTLVAFARVVLTVLFLGALVGAAIVLKPEKPNLAAGKRWSASSAMFECHPAQAECGGAKTRIFFHTKEEQDPWLMYDLGAKTTFSSMRVENRQDAVLDRAVPLVLEVSDDGAHFHEIARRDTEFSTWKPSFPPVTARYVRLRVARRSILHLEEVDIYR
ncbi:MAG TPA: discoidin domain-containing protein [Polyangiaceae bacterium]|nr:discoidin domain-containing protein [Polyangiaceae bacterium]